MYGPPRGATIVCRLPPEDHEERFTRRTRPPTKEVTLHQTDRVGPIDGVRGRGSAQTGFRQGIEGLRAVAVLAVVLFHADVPGVGGGYIGVDVFFVISGFLITGLLWREVSTAGAAGYVRADVVAWLGDFLPEPLGENGIWFGSSLSR